MKLIFIDTETTGLDYKLNEVVQLAGIIEIDGEVREEFNLFARPQRPENTSPEATAITGLTKEKMSKFPLASETLAELKLKMGYHVDKFDKADKFQWIGQNPSFDMNFLRAFFVDNRDKYFGSWFDNRPIDTIGLAKVAAITGHINPPNFRLGTLADIYGIELKAHDAMEDVRATRQLFHKLLELIKRPTVGEVQV